MIERVQVWDGPVLLEAPKGYGKTRFASHLAEASVNVIRVDGHDLVDGFGEDLSKQKTLVVDGVTETLSPGILETLCAMSGKVVITGRDLGHLARWSVGRNVLQLGDQDLALDRQDIKDLATLAIGPENASVFADAALALTRGWPALVSALLADADQIESIRAGVPGERWDSGANVRQLVHDCIENLDEVIRDAFGQLVHLPSFSTSCVTAIAGPGGVARARADGLPIVKRSDGWLVVARPVEAALKDRDVFRPLSAEVLGPVLVASGGLVFAAKALLAAGDAGVAADLLCSVPGHRFDEHNQAEIAGMIRALDARLDPEPELCLLLARVHHNRAELDQQRAALTEAERRAVALGDDRSRLEAQSELLFLDLGEADEDSLVRRLGQLEDEIDTDTMPSTRVRLREIRAMSLAQSSVLTDVYASITLFKDASYEWESLGEPGRAASSLRLYASSTCFHIGRYHEAMTVLDRAAVLVESRPTSLVMTLELAARFSAMSGDRDRFDQLTARVRSLLGALSLTWLNGYVSWSEMIIGSLENQTEVVRYNHTQSLSLLGALWQHHTGVAFLTDSAVAFALVGEVETAVETLNRAIERRQEAPLEVAICEIVVNARVADSSLASEQARLLLHSADLPFERRWRVELERIIALTRAPGTPPDPAELLALERRAVELGLGALWIRLTADLGLDSGEQKPQTTIKLLGGFTVRHETAPALKPGHSTQLVKYLAVAGGEVPVEVVIEVLWPDGDPEKGRKRFRNVINRTRAALGSDSVHRNGDLVRLDATIQTDLARFRQLGSEALTGVGSLSARSEKAVEALNLYGGTLLPDDVYSDWVETQRQTAQATATGLVDMVLAHPPHDLAPSWVLETVGRIGAKTEELWRDVAIFSFDRGATECCRVAIHRAEASARELGFEPSKATSQLLANYR